MTNATLDAAAKLERILTSFTRYGKFAMTPAYSYDFRIAIDQLRASQEIIAAQALRITELGVKLDDITRDYNYTLDDLDAAQETIDAQEQKIAEYKEKLRFVARVLEGNHPIHEDLKAALAIVREIRR
jgi:hypothetical protein